MTRTGYRAPDYLAWAKLHHKDHATDASRVALLSTAFGALRLDEIAPAAVDAFLANLLATRRSSTCNRYRTLLQAMLGRAIRHGLLASNPVKGIPRHAEPTRCVIYITPEGEGAVYRALRPAHRGLFLISLNTGLRWSEQRRLPWRCVDFLTGALTIEDSKSGRSRVVPMNSLLRELLVERATERKRLGDRRESVFSGAPARPEEFFPRAVETARLALTEAGKDATQLARYTWHANRHTWASRLAMWWASMRGRSWRSAGGATWGCWRATAISRRVISRPRSRPW